MPDIRVWQGRAHRLLSPVAEAIGALHAQGKPTLLLVPEQFTLQAERELLDRLHLRGFMTMDVLSPSRLMDRVLNVVGADERAPLSQAGRRMAVSIALDRCEKQLAFYQSAARRRGFTEKMAALIGDMKRGGLTPDGLSACLQAQPDGMRRAKLADLAALYAAYEGVLHGRFGDSEDQLRYLAQRLPETGLLDGQYVYVYGFDALPQQMIALLCAVGTLCEQLTVALVCDTESAPDGELYRPVRQSVERFAQALRDKGLSLAVQTLPSRALDAAPAIRHLDETLFAYPERRWAGDPPCIFLSQHMSPFEEATVASRHILRLCAEGMDIERIAVLYPAQNGYAFAVAAALTDSGLPFYTDEKLPAASHGLARFLLAALAAMAGEYQREDVLAVLKSGYAPLTFDEACALENYAREYGINRKKWLTPFTKGEEGRAARCEALRQQLMAPLYKARAAIVAARDARASLAALMGLLGEVDAYGTLKAEEAALLAANLPVRAGQNSQMWQTLLAMMDQLFALSAGARIPLNRMGDRLAVGLSAVSLAALPPASQMLHAGTLGHFLSGEMDAVFLLGLNDGVLTRGTDSLLTEEERAQTEQITGAYLGMTDESRSLFARMDAKRAMTLPTRFLFLSYAKTDPAGKALRPLDLLSVLQTRLFDGLPETPVPVYALPCSASQALQELSGVLRGYADGAEESLPPRWQDRLARLLAAPTTAEATLRLLRAADYRVDSIPIPPDIARKLFDERTLSVSRLEEFAACPFKHFVAYGLRPSILRDWGVEPVDLGVFYHHSLQNFAELAGQHADFPAVDDREAEAMVEEAVAPLMEQLLRGPMGDTQRNQQSFIRAKQVVQSACKAVTRHLAAGDFTLRKAEARFGYADAESLPALPLRLADQSEITLHGKIDRIDQYTANGATYLRVIDYKSSPHTVEAAQTWWGLQLQLMVYLDAAVGGVPGAKPAGAFYFHVTDPLAVLANDDAARAEMEIGKQLQMKGVVLADADVLAAMDRTDGAVAIAQARTRDGSLRKDARALDEAQMQALLRHTRQQATALAQELFNGDTAIRPVQDGEGSSCQRCDFRPICGYQPDARGATARELPPMSLDELKTRLDAGNEEAAAYWPNPEWDETDGLGSLATVEGLDDEV